MRRWGFPGETGGKETRTMERDEKGRDQTCAGSLGRRKRSAF